MSSDTPLTMKTSYLFGLDPEVKEGVIAAIKERNQLRIDLATARLELETERLRLAACGVAALGYFNGCVDDYKSASLEDVLRLRQQLAERDALIERMRDALIECLDDSHQVLSEYEQLYSATYRPQRLEAQKAIVSEAQAVLALTPPQALAEHDVEVRRKVLEEAAQDKGST